MNNFLNCLKENQNYTTTENGAVTYKSTGLELLDLFATGGAYRNRSAIDCINLFIHAYLETPIEAIRVLFYLRDIRGGQGERQFFRYILKWLGEKQPKIARQIIKYVPEYGRWDDLYAFVDTPVEADVFNFIKAQLELDIKTYLHNPSAPVSLLAKWLKSCNTSSKESIRLGNKTREALNLSYKQYRKTLSMLRSRINVLEKLMSNGQWNQIEYDKIPSKAGFTYRNAFAKHDWEHYHEFISNKKTKVNAGALYPYEIVHKAIHNGFGKEREIINKYWDNLTDYISNAPFEGIAVVDTSGSMHGLPIEVAISLGLYCAEKTSGAFKNHFITFSTNPRLVEVKGFDFVNKVANIYNNCINETTNIEGVFDLILDTAIRYKYKQEYIPKNIIIISDMEFDEALTRNNDFFLLSKKPKGNRRVLMETIAEKWKNNGYEMPNLIFWNVDCRHNHIPMKAGEKVTLVSGFSPSIFQQIVEEKSGMELMYEIINSDRYKQIKFKLD